MHKQISMANTWMEAGLHDLCQPLIALQCRLFLANLGKRKGQGDELAELRETVTEALVQCERMIHQVRMMQRQCESGEERR